MGKYDKAKKQKVIADMIASVNEKNINIFADDQGRIAYLYENSDQILDEIDKQFCELTGLNKKDIKFLFLAIGLHCVRQYLLKFEERKDDQEESKKVNKGKKKKSDRNNVDYYASIDEIINNPVPFDANRQTEESKGALQGAGKLGHRLTLGHDPVLGWIFGTSNIATSTLTTWKFKTYHVETQKGNTRWGEKKFDFITRPAKTNVMLNSAKERFFENGIKGYGTLTLCLAEEWKHLKSDVNTKNSLPFPIISTMSTDLANIFAEYGIDASNINTVVKQVTAAEMINAIIGILHGMYLYYNSDFPIPENYKDLPYEDYQKCLNEAQELLILNKVHTKKLIGISNVIASMSNVIKTAIEASAGKEDAWLNLDVGGIIVTIRRLLTDGKFIREIKKEFITNKWLELINENELVFEEIQI